MFNFPPAFNKDFQINLERLIILTLLIIEISYFDLRRQEKKM